jgi:ribulose-phosphate 3-epimerase
MAERFDISRMRTGEPLLLPSMLLCDFGNLQREVRLLEDAGIRALHLDVMDGSFVPNFSYGLTIVKAIRELTSLPLDVHLMMVHPERYAVQFCDVGANVVTIHAEAVANPAPTLRAIRQAGGAAGLAINPATPIDAIAPHIDLCDVVLVMTVQAGFGGQAFLPEPLAKLSQLRGLSSEIALEVDGGVNAATMPDCLAAGADWLVVGSAIFAQPDYAAAVEGLRRAIAMAARPTRRT